MPNIWKGSSGPISYTGNIVLHCLYPDIDSEYEKSILMPLKILFRLASPHVTKDDERVQESDSSINNDILTYENPPYITAEVDGIFKTKLGAIQNLSVNIDHRYQSFSHGGRPFLINVSLTIIDLYNVIVWNDNADQYAPNGLDIVNNLQSHNRDTQAVPALSDQLHFQFTPGSVFNYVGTAMTNAEKMARSLIGGGAFNTQGFSPGILNTRDSLLLGQQVNIGVLSEASVPSSVSENADNLSAWRKAVPMANSLFDGTINTTSGDAFAMENITNSQFDTIWNQSTYTPSNSSGSDLAKKWGGCFL